MHVVVARGGHDIDWLERHTIGWPALERRLREWPPERAAAVCRLEVGAIRRLGERLAATRPTAIRTLLGLQRHGGAAAAVRAICAIPAVTGDWRHVGGGFLAVTLGAVPLSVRVPAGPCRARRRGA
ncbi:MAG: hypothetical protein R3C15_01950 [Thermoleophilia bacterium]